MAEIESRLRSLGQGNGRSATVARIAIMVLPSEGGRQRAADALAEASNWDSTWDTDTARIECLSIRDALSSPTFGQLAREARRSAGLTQAALAQTLGVDFTYLSKIENDKAPPPAGEVVAGIAAATGTDLDSLMHAAGKVAPDLLARLRSDREAVRVVRTALAGMAR